MENQMENLVPPCHAAEPAQPLCAKRGAIVQRKNPMPRIDGAMERSD